tara:strand:+ start:64 stop:387 length:324 start_codon:yes stop_codon:yes gene_type:complete
MTDVIPFDPKKHKSIKIPGGKSATEYLASETSPEGKAWNIPQIWFDSETGKPRLFTGDKAWDAAAAYERRTGKKFPRFNSIDEAVNAAKKRSSRGGASKKSLLDKDG